MAIERHEISSREQWLALRKKDVTASVAGALLGVHEFTTPYSLWALKSGVVEEDPEESAAMRRGRFMEPVAISVLQEMYPEWRVVPGGKVYLRDPETRIGATPDLFVECPERGPGVVQIKSVEQSIFRKKWKDPETGEVRPPLWIAVQGITEAYMAGAKWAAVAPIVVGFGIDVHLIDIPIHAGVVDRLKIETSIFWRNVEHGMAPPADFGRDGEIISQLYGATNGETIDLTGDNRISELVQLNEQYAEQESDLKEKRAAVKAEIISKLGNAEAAHCAGGWFISAKTIHRKAYTVKESSYRAVRAKQIAA